MHIVLHPTHIPAPQEALRTASTKPTGTDNALGDHQLAADVIADEAVMEALRRSGRVATASSEERPEDIALGGQGFAVAYDPLDGSSVIPAGWAVGSIFGVWPGAVLLGRTGAEQAAAVYSVYGPRTILILARGIGAGAPLCQEFELHADAGEWLLVRDGIELRDGVKYFAPANLRSSADNAAYRALIDGWLEERFTLRYSGALVPDVHHILTKGGGVFCNPTSAKAPAKLRSLYEAAPLAYIVTAAGGRAEDERGDALQRVVERHGQKVPLVLGSRDAVARCAPAMRASVAVAGDAA